ncbi:MAG: response regulator [Candidatus Micrarchaeota archaeon]|nr:response regulator [Candidatus Micrarchaeota archaeon]
MPNNPSYTGLRDFVLKMLDQKQQVEYNELVEKASRSSIAEAVLKNALDELVEEGVIASRSVGGILTYYPLQEAEKLRKVLIVEDDKNISKLMAISIGSEFKINQIYDGAEAIRFVRGEKPDLVVLDLMLPHKDGLDICQTIKQDPQTANTIVILVSAMDPTMNRFKGIKYGADYYIRKPFDPNELRSLVTIFLRKKGKRFDPLIDLPDEERITKGIEHSLSAGGYTLGTLKIDNLKGYAQKFGERSTIFVVRLISQLLQDIIKNRAKDIFLGFLNSDEFFVAGGKEEVRVLVDSINKEFDAVLPFILADLGYKQPDLDIDSVFESNAIQRPRLVFKEIEKGGLMKRREKILKSRGAKETKDIGSYTYDELQEMLGREDLDIKITRDNSSIRLQIGKNDEKD